MSKKDVLIEIGLEEMPARFINGAVEQFEDKLQAMFNENRITFDQIKSFSSPRRIAVLLQGVAEVQKDEKEESKGPAKKIALDDQGNWTKAAQGFARGQGMSTEDIYFKEFKGTEYVYVMKEMKGNQTLEILPQIKDLIATMNFPKNMRWGNHDLKSIRPIRWLVTLYGEDVISFDIAGVETGRETYGHRFLGKKVAISSPIEYERTLLGQFVIADATERKKAIHTQIKRVEEEQDWHIPIDEELLDEITNLVEYPTAIYGSFDEEFLDIPHEVLITSMKEHQRYFPVRQTSGELLPYLVTVRNGEVDPKGIVKKGNEKVLRARLADARFFFEEDKKRDISDAVSQLENVVFHEELGSMGDKVRRLREIALSLATPLQLKKEEITQLGRAAEISKFDLVTQMVNEFPELQGFMGKEYAQLAGEEAVVSQAIYDHYLPRATGDQLPSTNIGAILSVADKIDTIVGCFSIGIIPTGSQDPYALRRQASGIVQVMIEEEWPLTLKSVFELGINTFQSRQLMKQGANEVVNELHKFFELRLKNRLKDEGIRYDVIDALSQRFYTVEPHTLLTKAKILMEHVEQDSFKPLVEAFTRVGNLAEKLNTESIKIEPEKFNTNEEHSLYETYIEIQEIFNEKVEQADWRAALHALFDFEKPIEAFFENVMVMVDQDDIRHNRLALLKGIAQLIETYADFSTIVFSSK